MKPKNTILITGGSGMVGSQTTFGIKPTRSELDILSPLSIEKAIKKYSPSIILHLAALVDMIGCEENPKLAHDINVQGTKNMAEACKKHNIKLVYMSTCVVFANNKKTPYHEKDKTGPVNVYGKTKLDGEKIVENLLKDYLIIRTGWLFGGGKNDKKFVRAMYLKMKEGSSVTAISNRFGSPTYVKDVLIEIKKLIDENRTGVYHVVNDGCVSYEEVAHYIKSIGKFKINVTGVKSKDIDTQKLKRGNMEALTSSKIQLRSWKRAVKEYLF